MTGASDPLPAGWYQDPDKSGHERWWDGQLWTAATRVPTLSSNWRGWLLLSTSSVIVGRIVAVNAAVCAAVALVVGVTSLVAERPLPGVSILVVPAFPLLMIGQLWGIGQLKALVPPRSGRWSGWGRLRDYNLRRMFLAPLPRRVGVALLALAFIGWLLAATTVPELHHGGPAGSGNGCRYLLSNVGPSDCASHLNYERAGAAVQRLTCGVFLAFFALHTALAWGGVRRGTALPHDGGAA